ncbi:hypothetical protein PTKIN_Ptkin01aG0020000 [Pterospermum kingtungense]
MGEVKSIVVYDEAADILEDLRFDALLKKSCGMLDGVGTSLGSNNEGDKKEISKLSNGIDMVEEVIEGQYEKILSNSEKFSYGNDDDDHEEEMMEDPHYMIFLENLKVDGDGQSYSSEIPMSSGASILVRYDEKEEWSFENVGRLEAKVPENLGGFVGNGMKEMPKTVKKSVEIGAEGCKNKVRDLPSEERTSPVDENEVNENGDGSLACKSSEEPCEEMDCDLIDESWAQYLDSLDKSVNIMEPSYESDQTSKHSKDDESCSDLEILELDYIPSHEGDYTPFVPSKCYQPLPGEEGWDDIRTSSQSRFRDKLMDLLKPPYDQQEYENLWREVTCRKPVMANRVLRNGRTISYPTGVEGKSYLDWYEGVIDAKFYISYVDFSFGWRMLLMKVHLSLGWTRDI